MRSAGTPKRFDSGRIRAGLKQCQSQVEVHIGEHRIEGANGLEFSGGVLKAPVAIGKEATVIVLSCAVFRGGAQERERQKGSGAGGSAGECQVLKYQLQGQLDLARRAHTGHAAEG
jgi:hypothetical protein